MIDKVKELPDIEHPANEEQKRFVLSKNVGLEFLEGDRKKLERINDAAVYVYNLYYSYYFLSTERFRYLAKPFTGKRKKNIEEAIAPYKDESSRFWQETNLPEKINEVIQNDLPEDLNTEELIIPIRNAIAKSFDFERQGIRFEKYPSSLQKKNVPLFFDVTPDTINNYFKIVTDKENFNAKAKHKNRDKDIELTIFNYRFKVKISKVGSKVHDILLSMLQQSSSEYKILSSAIRLHGKDKVSLSLNYEQIGQFTSIAHPDKNIILGIDLGINYPAFGAIYPNKIFKSFGCKDEYFHKERQFRKRKELLSQITHNTTAQEIKLRTAEANFKTAYNHKLSNDIIRFAKGYNAGIIHLEKLGFSTWFKNRHIILKDWDYAQLRNFIIYKARHAGIVVKMVNARYTSQLCSEFNEHARGRPMAQYDMRGSQLIENVFNCNDNHCKNHFTVVEGIRNIIPENCPECGKKKTVFKLIEKLKGGKSKTWYTSVCQNDKIKQDDGVMLRCKNFYHFCKRDGNAALNIAKQPVQTQRKKKAKQQAMKQNLK